MEKQIEEMARDLDTCPYIAESIGTDKHEGSTRIAQYLYEKGYRKQSKNVVELSCKVGDLVYETYP